MQKTEVKTCKIQLDKLKIILAVNKIMEKITIQEASRLIDLARESIVGSLEGKKQMQIDGAPKRMMEKQGIFVTLYVNDELRGCVGYPYPKFALLEGLVKAANSAAFADSRFMPIGKNDLKKLKIEISVMTKPEEIKVKKREDLLKEVVVGKHGLIAEIGIHSGLLLPQVATNEGWDVETFLGQTCWKAGLSPAEWLSPQVKFYRFEAQIFTKNEKGQVIEKKMNLKR